MPNIVAQLVPNTSSTNIAQVFPWPQAADYAFRDEHRTPLLSGSGPIDGSDLLQAFVGSAPAWVDTLMMVRNQVMGRLGLKTGLMPAALHGPLQVGQYLGMFQVHHLRPDLALIGEDDHHLDFRIFVWVDRDTASVGDAAVLVVGTWVRPHNWEGKVYLAAVRPFHWLISKIMIRRLARRLVTSTSYRLTGQS